MNLKDFIADNKAFDERTFGKFVRQRREELGKTVRGFAAELNITPAYLSDIEKGNRAAPNTVGSLQGLYGWDDDICV